MDDNEKYNIKVVERCFKILDLACRKHIPISIQDVCDELDVNSNMAFRLLTSIQRAGYLDKNPVTGLFSLSLKCLGLSRTALQSMEIRKLTMPYLELLWTNFQKANVNMGVRNGPEILIIDRIDGQSLPRTYFTPGRVIPFHCTGLGKVLCSQMSESEVDEMIEAGGGLKAFTPETITEKKALMKELESVRIEGVGRDRNEYISGDNCSAVPIMNGDGKIVAAISVSALEPNMSKDEIEGAIPKLKEMANRISSMLGYYAV